MIKRYDNGDFLELAHGSIQGLIGLTNMVSHRLSHVFFVSSAVLGAAAQLLPFESIQLTQEDVAAFPAVDFGDRETAPPWNSPTPRCRAWPGSPDWPTESEWEQLNTTLGGALLRPLPAASACYWGDNYNESLCEWLINESSRTHFWIEEPLSTLTQWPQGSTCPLVLNPPGECTRGGYPEYVVNATTVKHVQAAVNFARNKNVRLIIK